MRCDATRKVHGQHGLGFSLFVGYLNTTSPGRYGNSCISDQVILVFRNATRNLPRKNTQNFQDPKIQVRVSGNLDYSNFHQFTGTARDV